VPALLAPLVGFALGVLLAWLGRAEAPREDAATGKARGRVAALFGALVFAPACAYFVVFACDWALFYLVDERTVPSALLLVLLVVDAATVPAGFHAAHRVLRSGRYDAERLTLAMGAGPAGVALATVLAFMGRLSVDGSYHQVTERFGTRPVAGGPLGWAILWMGAMIVAGVVVAAQILAARPRPAVSPEAPGPAVKPQGPLLGRRRR